jgi:hypothetical protein
MSSILIKLIILISVEVAVLGNLFKKICFFDFWKINFFLKVPAFFNFFFQQFFQLSGMWGIPQQKGVLLSEVF